MTFLSSNPSVKALKDETYKTDKICLT